MTWAMVCSVPDLPREQPLLRVCLHRPGISGVRRGLVGALHAVSEPGRWNFRVGAATRSVRLDLPLPPPPRVAIHGSMAPRPQPRENPAAEILCFRSEAGQNPSSADSAQPAKSPPNSAAKPL